MAAKWRSFLTILGIVIGVAAVIIIFSIGLSAQKLILDPLADRFIKGELNTSKKIKIAFREPQGLAVTASK